MWEMMSAVNATLHDHPDSPIGRLMSRFYSRYLSEEGGYDFNSVSPSSVAAHGKSLSSLLFLSFGIFLLNAVDVIAKRGGGGGGSHGRSFDSSTGNNEAMALKSLMLGDQDEDELLKEVGLDGDAANYKEPSTMSADSYLRLVMNLMNARRDGGEREMQCLWSLYCHQLNRQASLGGPLGTVARLNSVAMRLVLQAVPSEHVWGAAARAVAKWEDVQCGQLFPECDKQFDNKDNGNNDGGGENMEGEGA